MNPYQFEVTCDVCGGPAVGTLRTAAAAWDANATIAHKDPRVCGDFLQREREKLSQVSS